MAPPPSYDSLYGRVKSLKQESSGFVDFFKKFIVILLGTIGCTICIGLILAIPISMIAMGSVYLYQCPIQRFIPIYLIVGGVFGIIKNLSSFGQRARNQKEDKTDENAKTNPFDGLLGCFLCAWFIAGNYWIYSVHRTWSPNEMIPGPVNTTVTPVPTAAMVANPNYCQPTLYLYAFWLTTSSYILVGCICFFMCCCGIIAACCGGKD
ncbi:uncharacterized protein LOC106152136 [Lingula anatina]|uniref:Uncharacterized protein LOC106152136 n=1 Tax=Lingula anatina TaxID=7574 RepID=A0A1S3H540_LINAN|nr:uncharacterized protein LOC106152136 [Lingula anatina]|eukprot:XP_013381082.1 uncharacterized protein LOC106152136 [Lingula anatina]